MQLDIRTVTSSLDTLQHQINAVQTFGTDNALVLNPSKCEFLQCHRPNLNPRLSWGIKPTKHYAKCLGYWWCWDLSDTTAIEEAIMKARRAFFAFRAMGAFHGKLNPISGRMIFDTCVIPILLYGSENWILTASLLDHLEAFQGEIGRRILKLSKFHSTLSALKWPSIAARVLIRKLNLLLKISSEENSISSRIFSQLAATDLHSLRIVQECRSLEGKLNCQGATDNVLNSKIGPNEIKKSIGLGDLFI